MTAKEKAARAALRDQMAMQVSCICMTDLSRQLSDGRMPIGDSPKAVEFIATLAYHMADALLEARDRK